MNSRLGLAMYVRLTIRLPSGLFACLMSIYLFVCLSIGSVTVCLSACLYERKDSPLVTRDLVLKYLAVLFIFWMLHLLNLIK